MYSSIRFYYIPIVKVLLFMSFIDREHTRQVDEIRLSHQRVETKGVTERNDVLTYVIQIFFGKRDYLAIK